MNRIISKKMEQSSVQLSLNNRIINSQSNWPRCDSFSSSSSDSNLYCSTSPQRPSFSGRKRKKADEPAVKITKRSRNSSGSSASSNLSCLSDKDISGMPTLISPEQVNNIETLNDISSTTFQHEALLSSRLSHPLDMSTVLPFRHNLRRNIRRKKCSCDCTATCTTVVVSRQYKGIGEQTVEEKTVISHTKVKTFVENSTVQSPVRQVQVSSKVSFQENGAHKSECFEENEAQKNERSFQENEAHKNGGNKRRRSEMEKLYDSLHEITWAKNLTPDNILRQFDVRQAASSSAFGKTSGEKLAKSDNKANKSSKSSDKNTLSKSEDLKTNKPYLTRHSSPYATRSTRRSLIINNAFSDYKFQDDDSNPPILEKSILSADETLSIDSPHFNTYPVLSKEVPTPEKDTNTASVDFFSSCNTITTNHDILNNLPKTLLNIDLNSGCNIDSQTTNLASCSSAFFDIAEDDIHTIDACFKEVGAEVVVSTCCDTDCNSLPLLTAVKEIHSSSIKSVTHDCPPVLEQCELAITPSINDSSRNCFNVANIKGSQSINSCGKFFPKVSPEMLPNENYTPPFAYIEDWKRSYAVKNKDKNLVENHSKMRFSVEDNYKENSAVEDSDKSLIENNDKRNCTNDKIIIKIFKNAVENKSNCVLEKNDVKNYAVQSFCNIDTKVIVNKNSNLPYLESDNEALDQNTNFDSDPPILESCVSNEVCHVNIKSELLTNENIKKEDKETKDSSCDACDKVNCKNKKNHSSIKSKNISQMYKPVKTRLISKSSTIVSGRCILKKYIKFINSKPKRQYKLSKMCNGPSENSVVNNTVSLVSNNLCNRGNLPSHNFLPDVPLSLSNCAQMPSSVKIINPSVFSHSSPSLITKNCIPVSQITKTCISSSSESCLQSTSTVTTAKSATVIQSFNQKLSFSSSQENITFNQMKNSSLLNQAEKKTCLNNKKPAKKSLNNIFGNHYTESFTDIPGYTKILSASKKKKRRTKEKVIVPSKVFTCHYQTINVTRGTDYIQIVLKITRGKSIFLTHETLFELKEALVKAGNDSDCRLLILNGFGQTFCLGLDLRPLIGDHKNQAAKEIASAVKDLIGTLADFQKPLVAIVNGAAYGLGLTILNHADVTLATSNATFCMPYSRLGYMAEGGASLTLPQAVGQTVAMDLILRGQVITAEQARDIGLVNEVVEVRHLPLDLVSRVKKIAENSLPGMEATKAMIKMRLHIQLPLVLEAEVKLLPQMWLSPSCQEAIRSTLDSGFFEDF